MPGMVHNGNVLSVDPEPRFALSPFLYMQFMEPLGATDGSVEAAWDYLRDEWRRDLVEVTQELAPAMIRAATKLAAAKDYAEAKAAVAAVRRAAKAKPPGPAKLKWEKVASLKQLMLAVPVINTNLSSVFRVSKACLRSMMKARRGRIINIASVVAATGNPGQANYCAAKAGMIGFTKSLAREVGTRGITVNAIAPGFIDTDMTRSLPDDQRETLVSQIPLGRLGEVDDIAAAAVFLASPQAAYITGETLHVNGGMHMD